MNDEYLWSKKGDDPEIRKMEELLVEFRFKQGSPPELPAMNVVTLSSAGKRRFAWIFAFATPAAAALIAAFWFAYPEQPDLASRTIVSAPVATLPEMRDRSITHHNVPDVLSDVLPMERRLEARPRTLIRRSRQPNKGAVTPQKAKLTREEKYAYDRLMLAISIAGSKLRIVQDTIDRSSDTDKKNTRNDK